MQQVKTIAVVDRIVAEEVTDVDRTVWYHRVLKITPHGCSSICTAPFRTLRRPAKRRPWRRGRQWRKGARLARRRRRRGVRATYKITLTKRATLDRLDCVWNFHLAGSSSSTHLVVARSTWLGHATPAHHRACPPNSTPD
jgi:hypothetical protein